MTPHPPKHDPKPRRPRPRHRSSFEQLEDRALLATVLGADIANVTSLLNDPSDMNKGKIAPGAHITDVIPMTSRSSTHAGTVAPGAHVFFRNINGGNVAAVEINLRGGEVDSLLVANSGDGHLALFSSGEFPVRGDGIDLRGDEAAALLVTNSGDGHLALFLGGLEEPDLPNLKALAMDDLGRIFGVTEGVAAVPIILGLGGGGEGSVIPGLPMGPNEQQVAQLQPLSRASLAVVATLHSTSVEMKSNEIAGPAEAKNAAIPISTKQTGGANSGPNATGGAALPNQSPSKPFLPKSSPDTDPEEEADPIWAEISGTAVVAQEGQNPVARLLSGLDEAFSRARLKARQGSLFAPLAQAEASEPKLMALDALLARWSSVLSRPVPLAAVQDDGCLDPLNR